jgi:hypothetical protein
MLWLFCLMQEPATPEARVEAEAIVVEGTSGLPDGAILTVELSRAQGRPGDQLDRQIAEVRDGKFRHEFRIFGGRVPPAPYTARVEFDLLSQGRLEMVEKVRARGFEKPFEWTRGLSVGSADEQIDGYRAASRRLQERLEAAIEAMDGFFRLEPPSAEGEKKAIEEIGRAASEAQADLACRIYALDDVARGKLPDVAAIAMRAVRMRAQGGLEEEALRARDQARRAAGVVRARLSVTLVKPSEIRALVERLRAIAREPAPEPARAHPLLLELAHHLGDRGYGAISEISDGLDRLAASADEETRRKILARLDELLQ